LWWRREICTGFWRGKLKERAHLVDVGLDERIILKQYFNNSLGGRGLDYVDQNLDKFWAVVSTTMKNTVPNMAESS